MSVPHSAEKPAQTAHVSTIADDLSVAESD